MIASLELIAMLLYVMLFIEPRAVQTNGKLIMSGRTDNRGNEALMLKMMTSKFSLYVVLLELTEQL